MNTVTAVAILLFNADEKSNCLHIRIPRRLSARSCALLNQLWQSSKRQYVFTCIKRIFCLLAIVVFIMTYNKNGMRRNYIIICIAHHGSWRYRCCAMRQRPGGYSYALPLSAVFSIVSFIIYLAMPSGKIILNKKLETEDTVLLSLNTVTEQ